MMKEDNNSKNFIKKIIEKDLSSKVYDKVKTRFPPEPNGYLHIGHAKSICLNFGLAKEYDGLCNLRLDDTNPAKEEEEYIKSIKEDVKWLGYHWNGNEKYTSDYFEELYFYAVELIKKGLAYVDELSSVDIKNYRGTLTTVGIESPYRNRTISENLALFEKMRRGGFGEGEACLRAKIDMHSSFIVLRDPVLYRVKFIKHHQTGNDWCIYPMYDFAHCISDAIEGVTHSICTLEFQDNRRLYDWILSNISVKNKPKQYEFSRLNLEYTVISKRKLSQLVSNKLVDGWSDPRLPTISGLRRRGFTPESIHEFCSRIGVTKQDSVIEISALESCVREDLNKKALRVMAVINPVKVVIENFNNSELLKINNHPNKPELGSREVLFSKEIWIEAEDFKEKANKKYKRLVLGKEVRLRNSYIIKANRVEKDMNGNVKTIYCTYDADTLGKNPADGRKVKGVIHWVSAESNVLAEVRLYNHLFTVPNPSLEENFDSIINKDSLVVKKAIVESSLAKAEVGQNFQFERIGYFCVDSKDSEKDKLVFNRTIGLRESE